MAKDGIRGPAQSLARLSQWASGGLISGVPTGTMNRLAYNGNGL